MAQMFFNANEHKAADNYDLIPDGWYTARVVDSEVKSTKAGDGSYLSLRFQMDNGRMIFTNLNLWNSNTKAVEIANSQMKSLCDAIGVVNVTDSQQLHGKPVQIKVATRAARDGYEAQNEIKGYKPIAGATPQPVASPATAPAQAAPPWARKE